MVETVRPGQRPLGEGAGVVGGALHGHQVRADVAGRDQLARLEPAPHLAAEPARLQWVVRAR